MTKRAPRRQKVEVDQDSLAAVTQAEPPPPRDATSHVAASLAREQVTKEREAERKHPRRPSEVLRKGRKLTTTFSDSMYVDRLREQARTWRWFGPDGRRPHTSKIIEFLVTHPYTLEDAERGRIPDEVWKNWEPG
jgi:hypothetical protein